MQLLQFIAAWLFPGAVCAAVNVTSKATTAESSEHDNASPAFSVKEADSGSSMSSSSSSSSSSSDDHPRFFTPRQPSPPASPLCFGAGGRAGRLLLRGSRGARARSPTKQKEVAPAKADVVGRYLRKISRRLRKSRAHKESPSPGRAVDDDTARERAVSVARAISYCKDTLRRGAAPPPRPAPSPSLDDWLHGRQEDIIASAAAYCNGESTDSRSQTPPPRPRPDGSLAAHCGIECRVSQPPLHRAGELAEVQAVAKQRKESACPPSPCRDASITVSDVARGKDKESPHEGLGAIDERRGESVRVPETAMSSSPNELAADELEMRSSFDEMQFLKIFHGDEEMIAHHFITLQI